MEKRYYFFNKIKNNKIKIIKITDNFENEINTENKRRMNENKFKCATVQIGYFDSLSTG